MYFTDFIEFETCVCDEASDEDELNILIRKNRNFGFEIILF